MEMKFGNITEVHAASYVGSVAVLRGTCRGENGWGRYKSDLCARYLHDHFLFVVLLWFPFHYSCFCSENLHFHTWAFRETTVWNARVACVVENVVVPV